MNKEKVNEIIQWSGALFIILMHVMNSALEYGYNLRPYNLVAAALGTICFMLWSYRVTNKPQLLVNVVAMAICVLGLVKAFN
jgi:hypothetical protein